MRKVGSIATVFFMVSTVARADSWTGRLVDAMCKVSSEGENSFTASCSANTATHLFALELADAKLLHLDASGNEKAANAVKNVQKADVRATVTGSREGQIVKVESIELQ